MLEACNVTQVFVIMRATSWILFWYSCFLMIKFLASPALCMLLWNILLPDTLQLININFCFYFMWKQSSFDFDQQHFQNKLSAMTSSISVTLTLTLFNPKPQQNAGNTSVPSLLFNIFIKRILKSLWAWPILAQNIIWVMFIVYYLLNPFFVFTLILFYFLNQSLFSWVVGLDDCFRSFSILCIQVRNAIIAKCAP